MRNVTVSLPDEIYRRARMRAAAEDKSLSMLVRELLMALGGPPADFERRRRLQAEVLRSVRSFRAGGRLERDRLHERDALR